MSLGEPRRPVFSDGERLTAGRLNAAFEHVRTALRRTLVAPLSPGVAIGLSLAVDAKRQVLTIGPGVAIERRGRVVVLPASVVYTRAEIEDLVGPLGVGEIVRVGIGLHSSASPLDPCAPHGESVREVPRILFRKLSAPPPPAIVGTIPFGSGFLPLFSGFILFGNRVQVGSACVDPWGDLDGVSTDPDDCSVQLGTVSMPGDDVALTASMLDRQGIAPRFDALRNSYDQVVAELRSREGEARTYFVAPAGGPRVQATHIAADLDNATPAARYSHNSPMVLELGGGTPTGSIPPGFAGVVAVPIVIEGSTVGLEPGTPLELVDTPTAPVQVAVSRLSLARNTRLFGLVGGAPHSRIDPSTNTNRVVVPLAVAGILPALIDVSSGDLSANTPLTARDANVLRRASPGDLVIARLAAAVGAAPDFPGGMRGHVFVVHPPYVLAGP